MKIRNPKVINWVANFAAKLMRVWLHTSSIQYRPLTVYCFNDRPELLGDQRYIFGFWHEHLFTPGYSCARSDTSVLIGTHSDGELITQIIQHHGMGVIRGSTTRGGAVALIRMIRNGTRHLAFTPDGPRGPRRRCQMGMIFLASMTGIPIVPIGFGYRHAWRARSWDRMAIPMPFTRIRGVSANPITVPPRLSNDEMEKYRLEVERLMTHCSEVAQHWAETGEFDPMGYEPHADWVPSGRRQFALVKLKPFSPSK